MKDSILKGTGNSRFLKSAIPDGTTWAEALAMLRAGTFPMDLNGINNAGFQQVGTPLNKANLLKDVNALTLGLTGDAVPDDMFNVLAHAGDLHVWKKTVVTKEAVPATYELGEVQTNVEVFSGGGSNQSTLAYASTPTVDKAGNITLGSSYSFYANSNFNVASYMRGNFIRIYPGGSYTAVDGVWLVPSSAVVTVSGYKITVSNIRKVTGVPAIPAGTTITYPVSTNRNAYQEGSDAKPAGYTLGGAASVKIISNAGGSGYYVRFYTADSVSVSDDGALSIAENNDSAPLISKPSDGSELKGKYIKYHSKYQASTEIVSGMIYFVPSDAVFTWSDGMLICDRVQLVTGYPAIPANTTIDYLGCLGDKARVQVVSYVGTGTAGASTPCSLTFDFPPKVVIALGYRDTKGYHVSQPVNSSGAIYVGTVFMDFLVETYTNEVGFAYSQYSYSYAKISNDKKKITWYNTNSDQNNSSGYTYYYLALG